MTCAVVATLAVFAIAAVSPTAWVALSKEDTGPEAATVFALLYFAVTAGVRATAAPRGARLPSILLVFVGVFCAGEEMSWGQRLLSFDTPRFFAGHNVQGETNVHNLVPPPYDALIGFLILCFFAAAPAAARHPTVQALRRRGVPWPAWRHVVVLFACALPAGAVAAAGVTGLEELVELVAVLTATAVLSAPSPPQ